MPTTAPSLSLSSSHGYCDGHSINRFSAWSVPFSSLRLLHRRRHHHHHPSKLRSFQLPHRNHNNRFIANASTKKQHLPSLTEQLSANPDDERKWKEARISLLNLGLSESDADLAMAKSFGWTPSPYWGEEKAKSMPHSQIVQKTVSFLQGLGLSDEDLVAFLKKFPEALGCEVENEMEKNVKILEKEWGISGNTLKNLLRRNPKTLGYNVDCKGDCIAQCTRCWVRF